MLNIALWIVTVLVTVYICVIIWSVIEDKSYARGVKKAVDANLKKIQELISKVSKRPSWKGTPDKEYLIKTSHLSSEELDSVLINIAVRIAESRSFIRSIDSEYESVYSRANHELGCFILALDFSSNGAFAKTSAENLKHLSLDDISLLIMRKISVLKPDLDAAREEIKTLKQNLESLERDHEEEIEDLKRDAHFDKVDAVLKSFSKD